MATAPIDHPICYICRDKSRWYDTVRFNRLRPVHCTICREANGTVSRIHPRCEQAMRAAQEQNCCPTCRTDYPDPAPGRPIELPTPNLPVIMKRKKRPRTSKCRQHVETALIAVTVLSVLFVAYLVIGYGGKLLFVAARWITDWSDYLSFWTLKQLYGFLIGIAFILLWKKCNDAI